MKFYLGTHMPSWLGRCDFPLFVSHRRLGGRKTLPRAAAEWALDSGGFTEIEKYGEWRTTPAEYVRAVRRYRDEIGQLAWASPQDWMCEPVMIARTGLSVAEHQRRTIENYLMLRDMASDLPFVPVLQGWDADDYRRHVDAYARAGVDLLGERTVGVGSVCRRQRSGQIAHILSSLAAGGLALHGFGLKIDGLRASAHVIVSADSMAWSAWGRRTPRLPGHVHRAVSEQNCAVYATEWRERVLAAVREPKQLAFGDGAA